MKLNLIKHKHGVICDVNNNKCCKANQMTGAQLQSSVQLFENTSVFKSLLKVVSLSILVSFVTGLYLFVDQVLMTKILPINVTGFTHDSLTKIGWYELIQQLNSGQVVDSYNLMKGYTTQLEAITSVIRVANSAISPVLMMCTAISLLISLGVSIPYSKSLGEKNEAKIKSVWTNGFYVCLIISILMTFIIVGLLYAIIPSEISDRVPPDTAVQIKEFFIKKRNLTIQYATNYSIIIVSFNILINFGMLFISLLNSEGKNFTPTVIVVVTNCLNMVLDFLLLYYTDVGMNGSAISTVSSYIIINLSFLIYIAIKNKQKDTFLLFKSLSIKNFKWSWAIIGVIFTIGLASFLRGGSNSLYFMLQQAIYANITNRVDNSLDANYYVDILGAVNPIYNLFFSAIVGVIRGARTVVSYNYGRKRMDNVLKAFWITNGIACTYGLIFYLIVCPILTGGPYAQGGFLWFFEITPNTIMYHSAVKVLNITMAQLILFSATISGMLFFQSTGKALNADFTSIVSGTIVGIPVLFICASISLHTHNMNWYIYAPITISGLSAIIVMGYSVWYIYCYRRKIYFER